MQPAGTKIEVGIDINREWSVDVNEINISRNRASVCMRAQGAPVSTGRAGVNGNRWIATGPRRQNKVPAWINWRNRSTGPQGTQGPMGN